MAFGRDQQPAKPVVAQDPTKTASGVKRDRMFDTISILGYNPEWAKVEEVLRGDSDHKSKL